MNKEEARECLEVHIKRIELTMSQRGTYRDAQKLRAEILRLKRKRDSEIFGSRRELNREFNNLIPLLKESPIDDPKLLHRCVELWKEYLAASGSDWQPPWLRRLYPENSVGRLVKESPERSIRLVWQDFVRPHEGEVATFADIEPDGRIATHTREFTTGSLITSTQAAEKADARRRLFDQQNLSGYGHIES
jgi:hypothetical protein